MEKFTEKFTKEGVSRLPDGIGMYEIGNGGKPDYVGHSKNVPERLQQHLNEGMPGDHVAVYPADSISQAQDMERKSISDNCPSLNEKKPDHCNCGS